MNSSPNDSFTFDKKKKTSGKVEVGIRGSKRHVTTYTIFETEKRAYSAWNAIQNNSYNCAWSCLSFGIGILIQTIFSGWNTINALAKAIACLGIPLSIIFAGVFFWRGWILSNSAQNLDQLIEKETQHDR